MSIKLTYFDSPVSRGEEARLALWLSGVEFEDHRLKRADWPALKPNTPFGGLPVLEVDGKELAQSVAVLGYIGRRWGLHPADLWEAAEHDAMLVAGEELRTLVSPTFTMSDEEKKVARLALAEGPIPRLASFIERRITGPFIAGEKLHVADIKLYQVAKWLRSGTLDHLPRNVLDPFPKIIGVQDAVAADPRVTAWYAR